MKRIGIKLKYELDGKEVVEEYGSLYDCAKHYQVCVPVLRTVIDGLSKKSIFPNGTVITLDHDPPKRPSKQKTIEDDTFYCEICQFKMRNSSKLNHLISHRHRIALIKASNVEKIDKSQTKFF